MCDLELNDLEYRDEKRDFVQPLKKHIPLKLNLSCVNTQTTTFLAPFVPHAKNIQLKRSIDDGCSELNGPQVKLQKPNHVNQANVPKIDTISKQRESSHKIEQLNWNFNITNIGKKVDEDGVFCCDLCKAPVLLYGRMIPCKHVFCVKCAQEHSKICQKLNCQQEVERIEEVYYNQVFICTYGKSSTSSQLEFPQTPSKVTCGRSYMSARDLQAHISHRHLVLPQQQQQQQLHVNGNQMRPIETYALNG